MPIVLAVLRHGRAGGQAPDSALLPEGAEYVERLAAFLARESWRPTAAVTSPYRRALETARVMLNRLAPELRLQESPDLRPDVEPVTALAAIETLLPSDGRLLVVSHLPLVARLAAALTGDDLEFLPGTFAEFELDETRRLGRVLRRLGPDEIR